MRIPHLSVQTILPHLELSIQLPRVLIDSRQAQADIGLKPLGQIAREQAGRGRSVALQAIAQTAREGDELARIEASGNPIVEQARRRGLRDLQLNVDLAPKHGPRVELEAGSVAINVIPGRVRISGSIHLVAGRFIDVQV